MTPTWTTALPDWERRIVARESLIPFAPLFPKEAAAGMAVLDQLRVVDMPGSPQFGEVSEPWVRDFCASIFGAYDPETGCRLVREWLMLISKKNTKSTTAGELMLAILLRNWRKAGEFGILAPTVEVANNAFKPAADAIRADDELSDLLHVQDHIRTITHRVTKATLQVVAAESETVAGKKWIVTLVDELWLFGKKANAEDMLREATGGLASRDEGCVIYLSTQSNEPPAGVFKQKLDYARGVRDGRIVDPQFCPVLYEFPPKMIAAGEHLKPENFYITNPNMGHSVNEAFLVREFGKAQEGGAESLRGFLAKHLNVEIGLALQGNRWAGAAFWESAAWSRRPAVETLGLPRVLDLAAIIELSDVLTIGIDGGGLDDMLGLSVIGRDARTGDWLTYGKAWVHRCVLERRKEIAPRLLDFEKDGDLIIIDDDSTEDVTAVADICEQLHGTGLLATIGVDPVGIGAILDELEARGIPRDMIHGISQGWKMAGAIKTMERKLAAHQMWHGDRPLMAWCVGNAKVEPRGNAILITKQAAGTAKIDPVSALINAAELMSRNPQGQRSFWEAAA